MSIYSDSEGATWFSTWSEGVSRYKDEQLTSFTRQDGLASNNVRVIEQDAKGNIWFGTREGLSRYDGEEFENFNVEDGLGDNWISDAYSFPDGSMWFGTLAGVSRYDGRDFPNFTMRDGLSGPEIIAIYRTSDGDMWFGTTGGGVSRYDGFAWTSLDTRDGLSGNVVMDIEEDENGYLWFGTTEGVTRYQPVTMHPKVRIVSVNSDTRYDEPDSTLHLRKGERVNISYSSIDFRTIPEKRQYRYRIQAFGKSLSKKEMDSDWRKPTRDSEFEWEPERTGAFTFEVQAIDRDLNYSEPASVSFIISPPPFYRTGIFILLMSILGSASLFAAILLGIQRWRLAHNEKLRLQNELQDAKEMQLSLLPEAAPAIDGMEISGRSITANTVGGDFFDYLTLAGRKVGIAIADVSGKGLKAAMNAAMASGMLYEVVKTEMSCGSILSVMNTGLYPRTEKQMFTAFSFAILDADAGAVEWSNAAQPHPLIKGSDGASEADEDGQLPLGMAPDVKYPDCELKLRAGDIVIFYTDGIIEAENELEEMYGTERLLKLVNSIDSAVTADGIIEAILQDVSDFVGTAQQYDDMTVVVVKVR
jgi:serine phosphatase RsbU (regulator of sigma subunit)